LFEYLIRHLRPPWRWQPLAETCRGKIWNTLIKSSSSLTHLLVISQRYIHFLFICNSFEVEKNKELIWRLEIQRIQRPLRPVFNVIAILRKTTISLCLSVCPSVCSFICPYFNNSAPFGRFSHKTCYPSIFSEICRKKAFDKHVTRTTGTYTWRTFRKKNAERGKVTKGSCSCTTMPRLTRHFQPRRNWPTCSSSVLITTPNPQIWPRRTTTCSLNWKIQLRGRHFSSDTEVIAAAKTWLDRQKFWIFFKWLAKVSAMG
jgi:hypothetical protein